MQDAAKRLILVSLQQADGTLNEIDLATAALDQAEINALINNADELARWFPIGDILNVEESRGESVVEEFNDGSKVKIEDGVKTFTGIFAKATPDFLRKIKEWGCVKPGAFVVDKQGNLIGDRTSSDGKLRPIPINANTWDPKYIPATDTTVPKIQLDFEWRRDFSDTALGMLLNSDFASGVDLLDEDGLIDLFGTILTSPAPIATGLTIDIFTDYGSAKGRKAVSGLDLVTDFDVVASTSGVTAIATSVEDATIKGRYAITFTSLSLEDVYVQKKAATLGYSDTNLITEVATLTT